jgi:hypothetical protein
MVGWVRLFMWAVFIRALDQEGGHVINNFAYLIYSEKLHYIYSSIIEKKSESVLVTAEKKAKAAEEKKA